MVHPSAVRMGSRVPALYSRWCAGYCDCVAFFLYMFEPRVRIPPSRTTFRPLRLAALCTSSSSVPPIDAQASSRETDETLLPHVPPLLRPGLRRLVQLILRDFVRSWHARLLPPHDPPEERDSANSFPVAVETVLLTLIDTLSSRAQQLDLERLLINLIPILTTHIAAFRTAEITLHGTMPDPHSTTPTSTNPATGQDDLFLAKAYADGTLHPAVSSLSSLSSRPTELRHLDTLLGRLFGALLPAPEANCQILVMSLRDLLSGTVVQPLVEMLSDPDFVNQLLSRKAAHALQEQQMVDRLRDFWINMYLM